MSATASSQAGLRPAVANATEAILVADGISRINPKRETGARLYKIDHLGLEVDRRSIAVKEARDGLPRPLFGRLWNLRSASNYSVARIHMTRRQTLELKELASEQNPHLIMSLETIKCALIKS